MAGALHPPRRSSRTWPKRASIFRCTFWPPVRRFKHGPTAGLAASRHVRWAAGRGHRELERDRALELLRGGAESVERWNRWRTKNPGPFDLTHATLARVEISGANLANVDLHASDLTGATLVGTNLEGSDIHRSNLRGADLSRAILRGADLHAANLSGCRLFGANLSKATLSKALFRDAEADASTVWPQGFKPKSHGMDPWPDA